MFLDVRNDAIFISKHILRHFSYVFIEREFCGRCFGRPMSLSVNMILNYTIFLHFSSNRRLKLGSEANTAKRESEEPVFVITTVQLFFLFELLSSFVNNLVVSVR